METAEQTRAHAEREAKITVVGDILATADCLDAFEHLTTLQVERLHDAIMAQLGARREAVGASGAMSLPPTAYRRPPTEVAAAWTVEKQAAAMILHWAHTMATDPAPGSIRFVEGWNAGLQALGERIRREFGL